MADTGTALTISFVGAVKKAYAQMRTTGAMFGTGVNSHGSLEITDLKPTTVSPDVFAVPAGYTRVSPGTGE